MQKTLNKKARTSITITPELLKQALDKCKAEGRKLSSVIEILLDNWIRN